MKRGIYLVANKKSQVMVENLIHSIRVSGCMLPIRLIHFGGKPVNAPQVLNEVEFLRFEEFSPEAKAFVRALRQVLTDCPFGFLYRFLAWFSDWDEFIYSDNDIVALMDWQQLFEYLDGHDLVHADTEYTTKGAFNYNEPEQLQRIFGTDALASAMTAGHIVVRRSNKMIDDMHAAINWFKEHPGIPQKHDQALLHVASLVGNWKIRNLCRPPYSWMSSWAGDYENPLRIIQNVQNKNTRISHIHYSGGTPIGHRAIEDFLYSGCSDGKRMKTIFFVGVRYWSGYYVVKHQIFRTRRFIKKRVLQYIGFLLP